MTHETRKTIRRVFGPDYPKRYALPPHMTHLDMSDPANRLRGVRKVTTRGRYVCPEEIVPERYIHMAVPLARAYAGDMRHLRGLPIRKAFTRDRGRIIFWFNDSIDSTRTVRLYER